MAWRCGPRRSASTISLDTAHTRSHSAHATLQRLHDWVEFPGLPFDGNVEGRSAAAVRRELCCQRADLLSKIVLFGGGGPQSLDGIAPLRDRSRCVTDSRVEQVATRSGGCRSNRCAKSRESTQASH